MEQELHVAADAGNSKRLREILDILQLSPAKEEEWLRKTLLRASFENRHQAVTALLAVKANGECTDERGEAPIHWASRRGHGRTLTLLLRHRCSIGQQTPDGSSALHMASQSDVGEIVQILLESRADPCLVTKDKRAALHVAAEHGSLTAAAVLLEPDPIYDDIINAAMELKNVNEETPLHRSSARGHAAVTQLLLRSKAEPHVTNWWGHNTLQLAAYGGHVAASQVLLDHDGQVNAKANDGMSPLHTAAERGHAKVAELLLRHGAFADRKSTGGRTPLHAAAEKGAADVIAALLQHGIDIEDRTEQGRTPLSLAAGRGHVAACRLLMDRAADPLALDLLRQAPMHAAAANGQGDVIELLVQYHARVDMKDAAERLPISIAHQAHQENAVRVLLKLGATLPDEILNAEEMIDVVREVEQERLKELVKDGDTDKVGPLMRNAERDFEGARQKLIKLAVENCRSKNAPAIHVYEVSLAETRSITKIALESEEKLKVQVEALNSQIAKCRKESDAGDKELGKIRAETDKVKASYIKKMKQVSDMKKDINEHRANAKKMQIRTDTLVASFADSVAKMQVLQDQLAMFQKEGDAAEEKLNEVKAKLAIWHERKREAAMLHKKAQDLLNRDRTEPANSPRSR